MKAKLLFLFFSHFVILNLFQDLDPIVSPQQYDPAKQDSAKSNKFLFSKSIEIRNKTLKTIYVATYHKWNLWGFRCNRSGDITKLNSLEKKSIQRPIYDIGYDRILVFSDDAGKLKKKLSKEDYTNNCKVKIGGLHGSRYYIIFKDNVLAAYNKIAWKLIKPIYDFFHGIASSIIDDVIDEIVEYDYISEQAEVRMSTCLPEQEEKFLKSRKSHVKKGLEKFLACKIDKNKIPNIAFCFSGGGYRSMTATLGTMLGAEKMGLLDCVNYIAGLSGSGWLIAPWIAMAESLTKYKKRLKQKIKKHVITKSMNIKLFGKYLLTKILLKQDLSLVDSYGSILANDLLSEFGDDRFKVHFSDFAKSLKNGRRPLPICAAVEATHDEQDWIEFTPYEVGCINWNFYVPTWAFGRKFVNGISHNYAPEQSLGFLMGIWGSAFSISFEEAVDLLKEKVDSNFFLNIADVITDNHPIGDYRISSAKVRNFTYGMLGSPSRNIKQLKLVDAGIDFNLPLPPLLRPERKIDILIVCDYSTNSQTGLELQKAVEYARRHGIKFPKIDLSSVKNNIISVFSDDSDSKVPTVIYLPLIKNEKYSDTFDPAEEMKVGGFCNTLNFEYGNSEFEKLCGLTEFSILSVREKIKQVIEEFVNK